MLDNTYRDVKTNTIYEVINPEVIDATNNADEKKMVLYVNPVNGAMFVREVEEFFDGRFEKIGHGHGE